MTAYAEARAASHELAIEAARSAHPLLAFIARDWRQGPWQGTVSQLARSPGGAGRRGSDAAEGLAEGPRGLSGMLRELAPALRATGVAFTPPVRQGRNRTRLMRLELVDTPPTDEAAARPSASSAPSAEDATQKRARHRRGRSAR